MKGLWVPHLRVEEVPSELKLMLPLRFAGAGLRIRWFVVPAAPTLLLPCVGFDVEAFEPYGPRPNDAPTALLCCGLEEVIGRGAVLVIG